MDKPTEGFTLIETLVVLMVMGVILALGTPSFLNLIEKMSTESETKALVEALRTARLVAIEERQGVVVCPSANGLSCGASSSDWASGFLAFRDNNNDKSLDAGEEVLFTHNFRQSVLVKIPNDINRKFYYNENGWTPGSASSVLICAKENQNKNGFRVVVNRAGRIRVEDSNSTWPNGMSC
jgi:type IV fimbrial biogenesis protein FimT